MNHTDKAKLYGDAASYIEKHGWTRGQYVNQHGAVCLVGAIAKAGCHPEGVRFGSEILPELRREIPKISWRGKLQISTRACEVTGWNDFSLSSRPVLKLLRHLEAMHAVAALEELSQKIELLQRQLHRAPEAKAALEKENAQLRRGLKLWRAVAQKGHDYDQDIADLEEELRGLSSTYDSLATKR